jgi:hypothetical protein
MDSDSENSISNTFSYSENGTVYDHDEEGNRVPAQSPAPLVPSPPLALVPAPVSIFDVSQERDRAQYLTIISAMLSSATRVLKLQNVNNRARVEAFLVKTKKELIASVDFLHSGELARTIKAAVSSSHSLASFTALLQQLVVCFQ